MATCKAVVQEGPRKGESCKFPPSENAYCGRHQRNRQYDEGIKEGKHWCRYFFRGCDAELTTEEQEAKEVSCAACRAKLTKKKHACEHTGCTFKVNEPGFCKKHERDKYRKEEQEKGIRYCDIARGCFTVCKDDMRSCNECLAKTRIVETKRYTARKEMTMALQATEHTTKRLCTQCGKDFQMFSTRYGKESLICSDCSSSQKKQDDKRKDRVRNYKSEKYKNIKAYYKEYITSATKKGRDITIHYNTFKELVTSPCHYCNHAPESETNGIDRVDNSKGYIKENCVSSCWKCNRIKHAYHQEFFIEKCRIMTKQKEGSAEFFKAWQMYYYRSTYRVYSVYKKGAENRMLDFNITDIQFKILVKSPCYLCGYQSAKGIGIDRVDNTIRKYSLDNCRPCCGSCNDMKGEFSLQEFLEHCTKVVDFWADKESPSLPAPEDPLKEVISKGGLMPAEERKHWKALGLYYAILSDTAESFLESYSNVYERDEFISLCETIKGGTKEIAVKLLQTLLQTLKKRKQRSAAPLAAE
jgi:hypothetical protein